MGLGANIGDYGGWSWYHAAELLSEFVVARTALHCSRRQLASELEAQTPSVTTSGPGKKLRDMTRPDKADRRRQRMSEWLSIILDLPRSASLEAYVDALYEVCQRITASVLCLSELAEAVRRRESDDSETLDHLIIRLDGAIYALASLIASLGRLATTEDQIWTL